MFELKRRGGNTLLQDAEMHCHWVCDNANRFGADAELLATVDLIVARSRKRRANYPSALEYARSACRRYGEAGLFDMVAVVKSIEGWLLMQVGDLQGATKSWEEAYAYTKNAEDWTDWTIQGNVLFAKGRSLCRAGLEEDARSAFQEAITSYSKCKPPHRNLRRALLESANLEHRMAPKEPDPVRAEALRRIAAGHIKHAKDLLTSDTADVNNFIRLLLARANQALNGLSLSLSNARRLSNEAYELAKTQKQKNLLMIARARHKQAVIECRAAALPGCEEPVRLRLLACQYATEALELASQTHNDRLAARIHTNLGNVYLDFPFHDVSAATREWEAAVDCMSQHKEDLDYVVQEIQALGNKLSSHSKGTRDAVIFNVTAALAFNQPLEHTIEAVEHSIVLTAVDLLGPNAQAISETLRTGRQRIEKHFSAKHSKHEQVLSDPDDVIFGVTTAVAFSQPLDHTIEAVERAIIHAAYVRYDRNEHDVRALLHISHERFKGRLRAGSLASAQFLNESSQMGRT